MPTLVIADLTVKLSIWQTMKQNCAKVSVLNRSSNEHCKQLPAGQ